MNGGIKKVKIYDGNPEGFYKRENLMPLLEKAKKEGKIDGEEPYYFFKNEKTTLGTFFSSDNTTITGYGFEDKDIGEVEKIIKIWEEEFKKN